MRFAILFPGQGSQFVGMGADVFAAMPELLVNQTEAVLGWSLSDLCAHGPEDELTRTDRAQPALFAVSYALWLAFQDQVQSAPLAAAGHSLGEYTALAAAGTLTFEAGLRLVAARGEAMAHAADADSSGMAALIGADADAAESLAAARREAGGRLWVANLNAPGQVVVAGGDTDIAWAVDNGREHGVRRVIPLKVAGAFHSPMMEPAVDELGTALAGIDFVTPAFPVYANATARPAEDIGPSLAAQLVNPVRFSESLQRLHADGVEAFVHIGPGDVTAGMARRAAPGAEVLVVSELEDIPDAADVLVQ